MWRALLVVVAVLSPLPAVARANAPRLVALLRQVDALTEAGRLQEANTLLNQAHELVAGRPDAARTAPLLLRMKARLFLNAGAFDQAETLLKQSIAGDATDPSTFMTLGDLYERQARWSDGEAAFKRAVDLDETRDGKAAPTTAEALNSLGTLYAKTGQNDKARPLFARVLSIFRQAPGPNADEIAAALVNLGVVDQNTGQADKALAAFAEAYRLDMQRFGPNHPNSALVASNAAVLLGQLGRFDEAAPLLEGVLAFTRKRFGDGSVQTAHVLNNLGWIELGRANAAKAMAAFRPALSVYLQQRALQSSDTTGRGVAVDEREVSRTILGLMRTAKRLASGGGDGAALLDEAFQAAQAVHRTKAAQALSLTTARFAAGNGSLAQLIREKQDLANRWQAMDRDLTGAMSLPVANRNMAEEAQARSVQAAIRTRIAAIDTQMSETFPDYATLADPRALSVAAVQSRLRPDEALVLIAPFGGSNGEATFTFVVTATEARWRATAIGSSALTVEVETLRCGLDIGQWDKPDGRDLCQRLTGALPDGDRLVFDAATAATLYTTLFGDLAPSLAGKTLLVVAPDPLASLPLQVLLTAAPAIAHPSGRDLHGLAWLGRSNAIAILPSTSSLIRTRDARPSSGAPEAFIGFGNPTLDGGLNCPESDVATACPSRGATTTAALVSRGSSGLADVDAVRALCPLPETGLELRCVAQSLKAPAGAVHEGAGATLAALRAAPLDRYRILHFATHGLLAGAMQTDKGVVAEPALVMTPPQSAQTDDDGLLRASEIAGLKLDADWVLLSACNTAAGSSLGGEAMSGLASAFFYAGARALLVSHWPVRSDVAVLLTTDALSRLSADPRLGRAEAIRRAEVSLMDDASGVYDHPAVWAPFSVVGDAGPMQQAPR